MDIFEFHREWEILKQKLTDAQAEIRLLSNEKELLVSQLDVANKRIASLESSDLAQNFKNMQIALEEFALQHGSLLRQNKDLADHIKKQKAKMHKQTPKILCPDGVNELEGTEKISEVQRTENAGRPCFVLEKAAFDNDLLQSNATKSVIRCDKFISFKHKIIYFAVPKVASQSTIFALKHYCNDGEYLVSKESIVDILNSRPEVADYFKFSIVRHPFSRAVSCYIDKVVDLNDAKKKMLVKGGMRNIPGSFDEFVDFLLSPLGQDEKANAHWASQSKILCADNGKLFLDAAIHIENLESELNALFEHIKLPPLIYRKLKNTRAAHLKNQCSKQLLLEDSNYWSEEVEDMIKSRYARDYELFGYSEFQ